MTADRLLGLRPLHLFESCQEGIDPDIKWAQLCWHPTRPNLLAVLGVDGVSVISWNDATVAETDSCVHAWSSKGVVSVTNPLDFVHRRRCALNCTIRTVRHAPHLTYQMLGW